MSNDNPGVRYVCASPKCRMEGSELLADLVGKGCPACGSKRLEVWHPSRGHVLMDYRSQVGVRKRRRRRLAASLGVGFFLAAIFTGCTPAPEQLQETVSTLGGASVTGRPAPTVSWSFALFDSACDRRVLDFEPFGAKQLFDGAGHELLVPETHRLYIASVDPSDTTSQIWRLEWAPAASGDSCFYPIAYPMLAKGEAAGILSIAITGTVAATDSTPGDRILFWRSHPWPGLSNTPDAFLCLIPVYEGGL